MKNSKKIKAFGLSSVFLLGTFALFAQETDDMYFKKSDRAKKKKDQTEVVESGKIDSVNSVLDSELNPDYLDRLEAFDQTQSQEGEYYNEDYREDAIDNMRDSYDNGPAVVNNYYGNGFSNNYWDNPYFWGPSVIAPFRSQVFYDPWGYSFNPYRTNVRVVVRSGWYGGFNTGWYNGFNAGWYDPWYDPWCPVGYSSVVVRSGWNSGWGYGNFYNYRNFYGANNTVIVHNNSINRDGYYEDIYRGRRDNRGSRTSGIATRDTYTSGSSIGRRPSNGRVDTENAAIRTRRTSNVVSNTGSTTGRFAPSDGGNQVINTRGYSVSNKYNSRNISTYKNESNRGTITSKSISSRDYYTNNGSRSSSTNRSSSDKVVNYRNTRSSAVRTQQSRSVDYSPRTVNKSYHRPSNTSSYDSNSSGSRSISSSPVRSNSNSSRTYTPSRSNNTRSSYTPSRSSSSTPSRSSSGSSSGSRSSSSSGSRRGN